MPGPPDDPRVDDNPFAAPESREVARRGIAFSEAERFRLRYIKAERSIRALGLISIFTAIALVLWGAGFFVANADRLPGPWGSVIEAGQFKLAGAVALGIGAFQLFIGVGLRSYDPTARVFAILWYAISAACNAFAMLAAGMMGGPSQLVAPGVQMGVLGLFLYLLLGEKAQTIFSRGYREVVAETPDLVPKSGCLLILGGLGLLFLIAVILAALGLLGRGR